MQDVRKLTACRSKHCDDSLERLQLNGSMVTRERMDVNQCQVLLATGLKIPLLGCV